MKSLRLSATLPESFSPNEKQRASWNNELAEWLDSKIMGTRDHELDRAERRARAKASPTGTAYTEISPGCTYYIPIPAGKSLRGWGAVVDGVKRYRTTYVE